MNLPNILTLSRIPLMFVIVFLMREDFQWSATLAFVTFVAAGITDWLDGYYARKLKIVSNFGALMDALTDKILMLGLISTSAIINPSMRILSVKASIKAPKFDTIFNFLA